MPQTNPPPRIYAQQHATGARTWSEHRSQGGAAYVLEDDWTWCAEQLPPDDYRYLVAGLSVWSDGFDVTVSHWSEQHGWDVTRSTGLEVVAWRPLPEPPRDTKKGEEWSGRDGENPHNELDDWNLQF